MPGPKDDRSDSSSVAPGRRVIVGDDERAWPILETAQSTLVGVSAAFLGIAPLAVPALLGVLALTTVAVCARAGGGGREIREAASASRPVHLLAAFAAFALASAVWSADPAFALQTALAFAALVSAIAVLCWLLPAQIARLPLPRRKRFERALPLGLGVAIGFILAEQASGHAATLLALHWFPNLLGIGAKEVVVSGERIVGLVPFYLDRSAAGVAVALPAALHAVFAWGAGVRARPIAVGLAAAGIAAVALSFSGAAKLAVVCSAMMATAVVFWPMRAVSTSRAVVAAGVVLALPLGHLPSRLGLDSSTAVAPSARERAIIWDRTAMAVRDAPLIGIGVQSTRAQPDKISAPIPGISGERRALGWHAHNFVLQSWLELGAVGAGLLLAAALALITAAGDGGVRRRTAGLATFAAGLAISVTGWSLWQPWLVAAIGIAIVGLAICGGEDNRPS